MSGGHGCRKWIRLNDFNLIKSVNTTHLLNHKHFFKTLGKSLDLERGESLSQSMSDVRLFSNEFVFK